MNPVEHYLPHLSKRAARWVRFGAVVAGFLLLIWTASALRDVLTPIVAAFAIAYILNPAVTWLETRRKVSRVASVSVGLVLLLLTGGVLMFAGLVQLIELTSRIPAYFSQAQTWLTQNTSRLQQQLDPLQAIQRARHVFGRDDQHETDPATVATPASLPSVSTQPTATAPATPASEPQAPRTIGVAPTVADLTQKYGMEMASVAFRSLSAFLSNIVSWLTLVVLLPMYTFFFLVHFPRILEVIRLHLPEAYRAAIVDVVATIDASISNFFRGRLLVCLGVGLCMGIGWLVVGVPHSLPLGALAGLLNLVPFMSIMILPPALFLTYADSVAAGAPWLWPVVSVFVVYLLAQALESFVLSPLIESRTSGLHPVVVVVALLVGGQCAGLLGMLLAIPMASTLKSLGITYVLPEVRRLAGFPTQSPAPVETPTAAARAAAQTASEQPAK